MERSGGETAAGECAVPPFAIYLNNVQLSIDYVGKLATSIGEALNRQVRTLIACTLIPLLIIGCATKANESFSPSPDRGRR